MIRFRRAVFDLMIPFNVIAALWVWVGRGLFGATLGWIALLMLVFIVPVLVVALIASTTLAFSQPRRPVRLSSAQAIAQATFWLIMLILGVVIVDVDDQSYEESILINILGWSPELLDTSLELEKALAFSAVACWLVLVGLLAWGRVSKQPYSDATGQP
ncbi:hypothetical protein AOT83_19005 [Mycobacteroides sp. H001]|uniref:hypothetical protein n=1 Tax=Mycobacteroides TaxID=670516 RepID=UPI000712C6AD|nr:MULTISPECIES: hypothetical protein [Mycobacteroides]KRQ26423.1 hypothetical protein AOT86_11445 [Mycobacteroides sp. H072]KRQ32623.1 hypothetical protein AOT84_20715 [Mycobacteroides sp. H002]KRQ54049.1 hypothetical protein AOT85_05215 [Mycobacteroides sp. H054]KRQ68012.1 hypothetical protein AOT83_19005 [Mycobacteroides sp. H001]OHU42834.1 hypothetical protein BKG79_02220 [Mycobacteroides chelonae]